ncbi:MAG TPA: GDSL-type esterase/lipase family protein [Kofleriaceae bacterium]|nr:GDSL-type esterase/lipase family protein [Kofleriaceae bacterium]
MKTLRTLAVSILVLGAIAASSGRADAAAGSQSLTINPSDGTYTTTRIVTTFGDSIAAGYCGIFCRNDSLTVRYARHVANGRDARVSYRGRAMSGEVMSQIAGRVESNLTDLRAADYVTIEGCGNDFLDARSTFRSSSNCADESPLANALATCKTQMVRALNKIAVERKAGSMVQVMALYYPGVNSDKSRSCNGMSHFDIFLDYLAEANWFTCNEAWKRGFKCTDGLAAFNAADVDTALDPDTTPDAAQIRISEAVDFNNFAGYYSRVYGNRAVITDANTKRVSATSTVDYLLSDDTHPTNAGHQRLADDTRAQGL